MDVAVREHLANRISPHAALVGRFLCPASRLGELSEALPAGETLHVGIIVDSGIDGIEKAMAEAAREPRFAVELVEVPLPGDYDQPRAAERAVAGLQHAPRAAHVFIELPRVDGWQHALAVIARESIGAKLRTGGVTDSAFPSDAELLAFVRACASAGVPFKCTAGLHSALRHRDPVTGFRHHGFLNILAAACSIVTGTDDFAALTETNAARLVSYLRSIDDVTAIRVRTLFVSYGSCSIDEPLDELIALGLLKL